MKIFKVNGVMGGVDEPYVMRDDDPAVIPIGALASCLKEAPTYLRLSCKLCNRGIAHTLMWHVMDLPMKKQCSSCPIVLPCRYGYSTIYTNLKGIIVIDCDKCGVSVHVGR